MKPIPLAMKPIPLAMKPIPTDLELLNAIYYRYYETFARYSDDESSRS